MRFWRLLQSFLSLPRVSVARLRPGDVIVIESSELLSAEQVARIRKQATEIFPLSNVIILDRFLRMKVVGGI